MELNCKKTFLLLQTVVVVQRLVENPRTACVLSVTCRRQHYIAFRSFETAHLLYSYITSSSLSFSLFCRFLFNSTYKFPTTNKNRILFLVITHNILAVLVLLLKYTSPSLAKYQFYPILLFSRSCFRRSSHITHAFSNLCNGSKLMNV